MDFLLEHPFNSLEDDVKLEVKRLGPHQPEDIDIRQVTGKEKRKFKVDWFKQYSWLTVSEEKKSLFCFHCVLFKGEPTWSEVGYTSIKHISSGLKTHASSKRHIDNAVKYKVFGTVNIAAEMNSAHKKNISQHNQQVKKNRYILSKVIDCIKFCATHELGLRGHDETDESSNRGIFLDLLEEFARLDPVLKSHLENATVAKYTSKDIQNELLDCLYSVYYSELKMDVSKSKFVSVQADEATDLSHGSQFVVILRFVKENKAVERFVKYIDIDDRTAAGLSKVLKTVLDDFDLKYKLIAQTYDGAAVMSSDGEGVRAKIKTDFPHAHFIHCYAHQLNLLLKQACMHISRCRIFFTNLSGFAVFFSMSPKRTDKLKKVCNHGIARPLETRWNFHSRLLASVHQQKESLITCFEQIVEEDGWDGNTTTQATGLINYLQDEEFLFFLNFFLQIILSCGNFVFTITKTLYLSC